ncbi:MAG: DUF1569 domain-containing protein [Ignavibacteria bacterium]
MNTLFDIESNKKIIERINHLNSSSRGEWGKMSVSQMLAHCSATLETAIGNKKEKRDFLGYLFGGIAKKQALSDKPIKKGLPTSKIFKMTSDKNFEEEKTKLISLVRRFAELGTQGVKNYPHPFFGYMTPEEKGIIQLKHLDHHLSQFGV